MDRPLDPGTSSLMFYGYGTDEERRPVRELYGVFRRPRNDADRRVGELAARWGAMDFGFESFEHPPPPGLAEKARRHAQHLGVVVESEGRVLLTGLGGEADMLYAAPTDKDCIAHALLPNGGGGCAAPGPDGLHMGWHQSETEALVVFGLVGDAIEAVDVVVDSATHPTRMGENAFGVRLERTRQDGLERLVLHRRDGTTSEIALK